MGTAPLVAAAPGAVAYAGALPAAVPAYGPEHYSAGAVVAHPVNHVAPPAPAPYTTVHQAEGVTTVHQPALSSPSRSTSARPTTCPATPPGSSSLPPLICLLLS